MENFFNNALTAMAYGTGILILLILCAVSLYFLFSYREKTNDNNNFLHHFYLGVEDYKELCLLSENYKELVFFNELMEQLNNIEEKKRAAKIKEFYTVVINPKYLPDEEDGSFQMINECYIKRVK